MAFESLSDKLQNVFKNLRSKGSLTEDDVKEAMKEVKRALLEADVNYKVVKQFVASVSEKAVGQDVMKGLHPGQMVIKIVRDEMVKLLGSETTELTFRPSNEITVIMMCGLQGAGKTTTAAKLAGQFKKKGKKPLLVACDVYRPAAIKQLQVNAQTVGVPVFSMGDSAKPVDIVKAALSHAESEKENVLIIDTAGRLQVDEAMMNELVEIRDTVHPDDIILTVDAMTGQEAVNVAKTFDEKVGITGVILTKLDGDTRGGAALSIRAVTGKPILYTGMGEKLDDLQQFYPDRMTSRILGMGDVETLIEKAENAIDEEAAAKLESKMKSKDGFGFDDYLTAMEQMKKMGGISSMLSMMPGMSSQLKGVEVSDDMLNRPKAIILSMTPEEREHPGIINPSRKKRIADGAGVDVSEVNRMIKQFEQTKKVMKQAGLMGRTGSKKKRRRGGMPGMGGIPGMKGFGPGNFPF